MTTRTSPRRAARTTSRGRARSTSTRVVAALAVCTLVAVGCAGGTDDSFGIGIKRVALALAFKEEELAEPVEPEVIVRLVPAPPSVEAPSGLEEFRTPEAPPPTEPPAEPPSLFPTCATAPDGASPADVVAFDVTRPPEPGRYGRHNQGTIDVTGGPFPVTLPFPPISSWEVAPATASTEPELGLIGDPVEIDQYEVRKVLAPGFEVIERFSRRPDRIQLLQRTTINEEATTTFTPTPAIDVYVFGTEGTTWVSAGVDLEHGTAMLFQGTTTEREIVDVCGTVYDSYRVEVSEQLVDLDSGSVSGTADGDVDVYNVATHLGGLVLREAVHQTVVIPPLVIEIDYVSTLDSVDPEPLDG